MKICKRCQISKEETSFYKKLKGKDGLSSYCKRCDCILISNRTKDRNRGVKGGKVAKIRDKDYFRNVGLRNLYGITLEDYNQIFAEQNGSCLICGKSQLELKKRLHVDHDHKTGKIRGLLCNSCNQGLGYFKDNKESLLKAIKYLDK